MTAGSKQAITTLCFPERRMWRERLAMLDREGFSRPALVSRLVRDSGRYQAVVLNGAGTPLADMAAGLLIARRRRRRPAVIFADCMWGVSSRPDRLMAQQVVRLIDGPRVYYSVHCEEHRVLFPGLWGVEPQRVYVAPYYHTLSARELSLPIERGGGVFAGGQSCRDYAPLVESACGLDAMVTIAAEVPLGEDAPPNVRVGWLSRQQYIGAMRRADVVVVPLQPRNDRSAGEQTYLSAMAMGKPLIVTDTMGVREYVDDRETGLIVPPGDPERLRNALEWVLDATNAAQTAAMAARAREVALARFGPDNYVAGLLSVLDDVLERDGG